MALDPISDLLTRIRNGLSAGHFSVNAGRSKQKERVLQVLADEGYIEGFEVIEDENGKPSLRIQLRYAADGRPGIKELKRISSPGRRIYVGKEKIRPFRGGLGILVVSTSRGVVSDRNARKAGVGGELICSVF